MDKIPVFIVDDQNLFRQSLAMLIGSIDEFNLLGDFESGDSLLEKIPYLVNIQTHVAIIDMDMPGMNGIDLNEILHEQYPQIKIIILSVHINPSLIAQMIHAKASAYLEKNCDKEELILAIQSVYKTGFYFNKSVLKAIQDNANRKSSIQHTLPTVPVRLTSREKQILGYICREFSNAEIANSMFISQRTVEGHRINLLAKTGCRNIAGLVLFAIKYGFYTISI